MKQSDLKKVIKSFLQEIKIERPTSNEEAYNKCLDVLGPFKTFFLTTDYDTLEEFITEHEGIDIEEFEESYSLEYKEFEPTAQQAIRAVKFGDVQPLFIIDSDDIGRNSTAEYPLSGFNFLVMLEDNINDDYLCGFLSKFPLKY